MDNIEVQTGFEGRRRIFTKRNFMILAAVVVAGLVIGLVVYFVNRPKNNTTVQSALNSSSDAFSKGDYTGALAALQGATSQNMTKTQKAELYDSMAATAASAGKVEDALHYYDLKHQIDSGSAKADAYSMALLYERLDNKQKAIEQYKIAIAYYKSQNKNFNNSNNDLAAMESRLQELEAQK